VEVLLFVAVPIGLQQTLRVAKLVVQIMTVLLVNLALPVWLLAEELPPQTLLLLDPLFLLLQTTVGVDTVLLTINCKELWDAKAKIFPDSLLH